MSYRFLDDWTMADAAFEAKGSTLEELFRSALDALMNVMVSDLGTIEPRETREETLRARTPAELLHAFLEKAVFYKDAELLLLRAGPLSITRGVDEYQLHCSLRGEKIDPDKQELLADVKAITHHRFEVKTGNAGWTATVVVDV